MFKCECGREFISKKGLSYHKNFCGNYKIFYDNGYECKIGPDGKIVYIHREVMEQKLGRKLLPGEIVHHIDENKINNDPDNLELTDKAVHARTHYFKNPIPQATSSQRARGDKNWMTGNGIIFSGELGSGSKLKTEQVIIIKQRLQNQEKIKDIASEYNVHPDTIRHIKKGQSWKDI